MGFAPSEIHHGASGHVDWAACAIAQKTGIPTYSYPADWDAYGKAAGPKRNGVIVRSVRALVSIHNGKFANSGTWNCTTTARAAGLPIAMVLCGEAVNRKTSVVNLKTANVDDWDVYAGRYMPGQVQRTGYTNHAFGNRWRADVDGTRAEILARYTVDFLHRCLVDPELVLQVKALKGLRLACWCAPLQCHCEVLAAAAEGDAGFLRARQKPDTWVSTALPGKPQQLGLFPSTS
jgi:hypothetical protein